MPKFLMVETLDNEPIITVRLGTGGGSNLFTDADVGKAVKLTADSRYTLCAAGDAIEAIVSSVNVGKVDNYSLGGIKKTGYKQVTFDGLQATPGTGTVAIGDYVTVGTVVAQNTALSGPLKVCTATTQATAIAKAQRARVVSLGDAGTGVVGTVGLIEML